MTRLPSKYWQAPPASASSKATNGRVCLTLRFPFRLPLADPNIRSSGMDSTSALELFSGNACFSPRVPIMAKKEWVHNGGKIAFPQSGATGATYVFCDGEDDPWFLKLYQRSIAVFHWAWISAVVAARFRLPISAYVIDGYSTEPVRPAYSQSGDPEEDLDRTLLSTPPLNAHIVSPSAKSEPYESKSVTPPCGDVCPVVDLRLMVRSRQARTGRPLKTSEVIERFQDEYEHKGAPPMRRLAATGAIPVSEALDALRHVSTAKAVQFVPGTVHRGKEFQCWYA
ncbi:hypothetical protein BD309DRAFT_957278 [Dichomitus squalens]|uniref:Uncharacterized protein n=1 Tax=Dichomitus squalens TaxID=114155 RepID=A0A4Q9PQ63_9APHY|nr:hypothetical protein BD309DRAFT_957278 [Dichomitus squalens]TBU56499.1 hypothetical protein BD310DRAFT_931293 [Dichomitus squalens]